MNRLKPFDASCINIVLAKPFLPEAFLPFSAGLHRYPSAPVLSRSLSLPASTMNSLFRKYASRRSLSSLISLQSRLSPLLSLPESATSINALVGVESRASDHFSAAPERACVVSCARRFHVYARSLGFKASDVARAEYAVDDFYDEEREGSKGADSDEGLEIAKLGISDEIVGALSKRGISKLFPIQGHEILNPGDDLAREIAQAESSLSKWPSHGRMGSEIATIELEYFKAGDSWAKGP